VGAHYRAVCRAKSRVDFIHKLRIVEEECDESVFWMELPCGRLSRIHCQQAALMREADEILAIVAALAKTARAGGIANKPRQS